MSAGAADNSNMRGILGATLGLEISSGILLLEDGGAQAHTLTLVPYYSIYTGGRAGCRVESRLVLCV